MSDVFQTVFRLSLASNVIAELTGTTPELQKEAEGRIPQRIRDVVGPGWEIVWGPVVWQHPGAKPTDVPDNVWYVARNHAVQFDDGEICPTYVLAIAGTAGGLQDYDWLVEDCNVDAVVDLKDWIHGSGGITVQPVASKSSNVDHALVANGTIQAVYTLINTPPPSSAHAAGKPLYKFMEDLSTEIEAGTRVVFTGHSLGAALSPTLALTLKEAGFLKREDSRRVRVYPTAGASPGNEGFVNLYKDYFPGFGDFDTSAVWNLNIVNMLDPVPQAWCTDTASEPAQNLSNLLTIFGTLPPVLAFTVRFVVSSMISTALKSKTIYRPLPISAFAGPILDPPSSFDDLIKIALSQHLDAYVDYILPSSQAQAIAGFAAVVTKSGAVEVLGEKAYLLFPVIRDLWSLNLRAQKEGVVTGV
jgi:hypothetical protein